MYRGDVTGTDVCKWGTNLPLNWFLEKIVWFQKKKKGLVYFPGQHIFHVFHRIYNLFPWGFFLFAFFMFALGATFRR